MSRALVSNPSNTRGFVGGSLVKNFGFEYAPAFVAATTGSNKWVDGTAAGSVSNDIYGWKTDGGNSHSSQFDNSNSNTGTYSMKLSTLAVASYNETRGNASGYNTAATEGFPMQPNTAYTFTFWMKTNYVSGDSTSGAHVDLLEANSAGTSGAEHSSSAIKTTTGWTQYTLNFTTAASCARGHVELRIYGHTGLATLIMDAWFDDISVTPTTNTVRSLATGRSTASNRGFSI